MLHAPHHRSALGLGIAAAVTLGLTACTSGSAGPPGAGTAGSSTSDPTPHGLVAGASEAAEPQLRLLVADDTGALALHDLLDGDATDLDAVDAPEHAATDGRFLVTSDSDRTTIVDGGSWTVDHGDHTHYYDAAARTVGTLPGGGPVAVASSESTTTLSWPDADTAVALDRAALGQGRVSTTARVDAAVLLPLGDLLVAGDAGRDRVVVLDAQGEPTGVTAACTDPAGGIVTRVGAVVGCADGAVLVTAEDAVAEHLAAPADLPRATGFANRTGRPTVAALAGDTGAWLLDTRERTWEHVPTDRPLVAVTAVDDTDEHVVALDADGRVLVLSGPERTAVTTDPLVPAGSVPALQVDAQRAYLADPDDRVVHEVDFADDARVARSIAVPIRPDVLAEVGR
ncbi:ABC transporter [Curtobacterium sp. VKM Ac-2865]|uniref:ABC transporter n=1 Tax=Curtobacterium sp. VKM Ac-2865 TaxID=2783817 RepID=UPI00188A5E15|nr:ABC transporter [Curtobacterium sp. VKM Ac-2865]MBF4581589.1 ABC transporter [Curtobacterium sp. VKM Ac-2865]